MHTLTAAHARLAARGLVATRALTTAYALLDAACSCSPCCPCSPRCSRSRRCGCAVLWGFLAYRCPRPVHSCVVGQGVARRATGGRMLTCDACDWTAPCVVVQPALSVSVACSLACHITCSLACRTALPVLLYLLLSHAASHAMRRTAGASYCRMPSRMPRRMQSRTAACRAGAPVCALVRSHAASHAMRQCFFDAAGQRATRWWGQLTGTSPDSFALGGSHAPGASHVSDHLTPVVAARIQPTGHRLCCHMHSTAHTCVCGLAAWLCWRRALAGGCCAHTRRGECLAPAARPPTESLTSEAG